MTSILCNALRFGSRRQDLPPAVLFSTAPIFSALAPRASRFYNITPRLLALLRRSPFFCFTPHFVLFDVTDEDVSQIIRECVSIKSLRIRSSKVTGSFINDAILSDSGGLITRTLQLLDYALLLSDGRPLIPLLLPSASRMSAVFLRSMASRLMFSTWQPNFDHAAQNQLLASSLDALESRREELWEPALMMAASLVEPARAETALIDASVVRRSVAIVEDLIDADEYVALLAVELLARLLQFYPDLVVPLLLLESDALRGALMLCDRYVERIKRGERVAGFSSCEKPERLPLRVIEVAVETVVKTAPPTIDVLEVLSYRRGELVCTVLDVIAAYRACPRVIVVDRPRVDWGMLLDVNQYRATLVADAVHGRDMFQSCEHDAIGLLASAWPRPFHIDGSVAQQQLLDLIEQRLQDVFAACDTIRSIGPAVNSNSNPTCQAKLVEAGKSLESTLVGTCAALRLVDKDVQWSVYERANAHLTVEQRALARVRLFNWIMAITRRGCCERDAPSQTETPTQDILTFEDILTVLVPARLRFERQSDHNPALSLVSLLLPGLPTLGGDEMLRRSRMDHAVYVCASVVRHVVRFLALALADCRLLLGAASTSNGHCRQRPDNEQRRPDDAALSAANKLEEQAFWAAAATQGLASIASFLIRPDIIRSLVSASNIQDVGNSCDILLDFAVAQGAVSTGALDALRAAVTERFATRSD